MKILILQDHLRSGGTERQSILLTRGFRAAGHDARLLTFRPGGALWDEARDVAPRPLQGRDWGWDWFAPGLGGAITAFAPDVLMAMGRMGNCRLGGLGSRHFSRTVTIATFRTGKKLPWLYRRALRRADHVVANSQDAARTLVRRNQVPAEKLTVIHNALVFAPPGADGPEKAEARSALRAQLGARDRTTVFTNVAMFRPEKNQRGLIEMAAELPKDADWQLWFAGDGPCRADCERLAQDLGIDRRVKFLGFLPDPTPVYAGADAAVHASTTEALSNFLIEAQAHGLPAIACEAPGTAECLRANETGWILPPGCAEAFRKAVAQLMALPPAARASLSSRAAAFAREQFEPAHQLKRYLELFERLVHPPACER